MALFGRLVTLAKSPQGRRVLAQAQKAARDPRNRERLEKVRSRIQNRGDAAAKDPASQEHGGGGTGVPSEDEPRPPSRSR